MENSDYVLDLNQFTKNSVTVDPNPEKFTCCLSKYALKQKACKRQYLHALPYYINEREERIKEMQRIDDLKSGSTTVLTSERAPLANLDACIDPAAAMRTQKSRAEFE